MALTTLLRRSHILSWTLQNRLLAPFAFLLSTRLLLNGLALAAVFLLPLESGQSTDLHPYTLTGAWSSFDSGYYLSIAMKGYPGFGRETNFFPFYPLMIRLFSLGSSSIKAASWAGWAISNLSFLAAGLLFWLIARRMFNSRVAWSALITLSIYPTAFFYSAIYTESLFLLLAMLVLFFTLRRQYLLAGVFVSLASLTRVNGVLLAIIPLVELLRVRPPGFLVRLLGTGALSGLGLAGFMTFNWVRHGSPIAFIFSQSAMMGRSITFPWISLYDSLAVTLVGAGGFKENWFMRLVSGFDLANVLLFAGLTVLAFLWLRRGLAWYMLAGLALTLSAHGPYRLGLFSGSRYVLALFPGFLVLGLALQKLGRWQWLVWAISGLAIIILTAWWASGRWVA